MISYRELQYFDATFYPVDEWTVTRYFDHKCIPMQWTTTWIRTMFVLPTSGLKIKNNESHPEVMNLLRKEKGSFTTTNKGFLMQQKNKDAH